MASLREPRWIGKAAIRDRNMPMLRTVSGLAQAATPHTHSRRNCTRRLSLQRVELTERHLARTSFA